MNIDLREENLSAYKDSFGFHYSSILAYLSTCFNDSVIVDLGTLYGNSAAALAYNKSNKVYTYDIESREEAISKFKLEEFKNVEYIITNCISVADISCPIDIIAFDVLDHFSGVLMDPFASPGIFIPVLAPTPKFLKDL